MNCCWISMFGVGGRERVLRVSYSAILLMPLRQLTYWIRIDLFDSPLSFNHLAPKTYFTCCVCVCHSVISDSLQPYELETARLLYPWNSPGKRILECVAIPFCWGSFQPRDRIQVSCIAGRFFTLWTTREAPHSLEQPGIPGKRSWSALTAPPQTTEPTRHLCLYGPWMSGQWEGGLSLLGHRPGNCQ